MLNGNWVPMDKNLAGKLPKDRTFSEPEAMLSLAVNYDSKADVTVAGLANRWGWSRGKVRRFLDKIGAEIHYPEGTAKKQNQRGQIVIQKTDRSNIKEGQIRLVDSMQLPDHADRSTKENGQKADRSRVAIKDPNPEPKNIVEKNSNSRPQVPVKTIIDHLNTKTGRSYRQNTRKTQSLIKARFREGFTLDDFLTVIDKKVDDWLSKHDMSQYLRPETLFGPKFESYLQSAKSQGTASRSCNLCRYNQAEPCRNLSRADFDPATCDSYQREVQA